MRGNLIVLLLFLCTACAASELSEEGLDVAVADSSYTIEKNGDTLVVNHKQHDWFHVEVDFKKTQFDGHGIGITPVIDGKRYDIEVDGIFGFATALIAPTPDAGPITHTTVGVEGDRIAARFEGGPYTGLSDKYGDAGNTYMAAQIYPENNQLIIELEGLYYIRPTKQNTQLKVTALESTKENTITSETPQFRIYVEDVRRVDVNDGAFGTFWLETNVKRLQLDNLRQGEGTFELDFDHSYKDRGQQSVTTKLVLPR